MKNFILTIVASLILVSCGDSGPFNIKKELEFKVSTTSKSVNIQYYDADGIKNNVVLNNTSTWSIKIKVPSTFFYSCDVYNLTSEGYVEVTCLVKGKTKENSRCDFPNGIASVSGSL